MVEKLSRQSVLLDLEASAVDVLGTVGETFEFNSLERSPPTVV
ncbi:hypothetical protein SynA18461_00504 [Synechococcus sp. A18-46.1]|nr:hypothetical protein SynA18461_00504 [Synechococcus sp. A18-46.1]